MSNAYENLKQQVTRLQRDADRARGAIDAELEKIREEFGVDSLAELETKIKTATAKLAAAGEKFQSARESFEHKYADVLKEE
jgi:predicted  nucleic acid-binding Zn-ribbon protein